ncbi:prim-pol domain-containing protein [Parathielavia appendiculata]|uniref:DNA primase n=1 Tax=Parathielavia appendiculata TaxID=2587402 RepID=A0AAN6U293_9PEZI|nr:prim-pol domain-containing protein [Parathielavia appendiculata]
MEVEPPVAAPSSPLVDEDFVMVEAGEAQGAAKDANPAAGPPPAQVAADEDMVVEIQQEKRPEIKLEDLFDGMDSDDDDFQSSSNPLNVKEPVEEEAYDPSFELLRIYYQRFFPWRYMFQWLNHSPVPTNDFKHREFSLWLHNDAVMRYQSYTTSDLFRKDVLRLMPRRIEIGPVYTADPRDRKTFRNSTAFVPMAKELCFDIDLTDYDDIRTCCDKANICNKCWRFTTMAIKVLDTALREDFGYHHILWVYSGRRGVHAWVCDKQARTLQDHQRKAIASYFEVVSGKAGGKRVNIRRPLHPHLSRSIDLLKEHFQHDVLETQDPWASPEKADALLLQHIPDPDLREALRKKWDASPGRPSSSKWADIDALAQTGAVGAAFDPKDLLDAKQDILLEHAYPRLDIAVSQKLNHLLKSPFVIHPGTGRVCVPIDRDNLDGFDPLNVPTLQGLVREVDAWGGGETTDGGVAGAADGGAGGGDGGGGGASSQEVKHVQDWEKTSLKPYIEYFRSFVTALMKEEREAAVKRERVEDGDVEVKVESLDF